MPAKLVLFSSALLAKPNAVIRRASDAAALLLIPAPFHPPALSERLTLPGTCGGEPVKSKTMRSPDLRT